MKRTPMLSHVCFVEQWRAAAQDRKGVRRNVVEQSPPEIFPSPAFDGIEISTVASAGSELRDIIEPSASFLVRAREHRVLDRGLGPVKFMSLLRRKAGMTPEEFSRYWLHNHALLVEQIVAISRYFRGYVQNHCVAGTQRSMTGAAAEGEVDGIVEIWFDSLYDLKAAMFSSTYMKDLRADEAKFVALPNRRMLLIEDPK
ncbi:MAG: EthD domain-containing protein [Burkholderiales bacterium]|nr:EthD domain-containing protein [Burkholderiales bacterium]